MESEYRHAYCRMTGGELQRVVREAGSLPPSALPALNAEVYLRKHGLEEGQTAFTPPGSARSVPAVPSNGLFSGCVGRTIKIGLFLFALYVIGHVVLLAAAMFVLSR